MIECEWLVLAGGLVASRNVDDAVGVNIECDVNLGNTLGGRGNPSEDEGAKRLVVLCHVTLSLENLDLHFGLAVSRS